MGKSQKKSTKKPEKFNWNPKRTKAAQLLSTGIHSHQEVAKMVQVSPQTISEWKTYQEFLDRVDELTLKNERVMRAGLARETMLGIHIKRKNIEEDKSSHLDYVKFAMESFVDGNPEAMDELQEFISAMKSNAGK